MSNHWKPNRHHYPDPMGDMFRNVNLPTIRHRIIPAPPIKINPLPGQIRDRGKLWDNFNPDFGGPFKPMRIRRTPPPEYHHTLRYDEAYARRRRGGMGGMGGMGGRPGVPTTPRPGTLRWMGRGLG